MPVIEKEQKNNMSTEPNINDLSSMGAVFIVLRADLTNVAKMRRYNNIPTSPDFIQMYAKALCSMLAASKLSPVLKLNSSVKLIEDP
jgi:di/tripeptidase